MAEKDYSSKDLERILKKALEIQARDHGSSGGDVDIEEIVNVGNELGLSRDLVLRAARELETSPAGAEQFLGGPVGHRRTALVPGTPDDEAMGDLGILIQREVGVSGDLSTANRQLFWKSDSVAKDEYSWMLEISVRQEKTGTAVEINNKQGLLAGGLFGGLVGGLGGGVGFGVGFGVGLGVLGSPLFVIAMIIGSLGGSYALARSIFTTVSKRRAGRINQLMEKITGFLKDRSETSGT